MGDVPLMTCLPMVFATGALIWIGQYWCRLRVMGRGVTFHFSVRFLSCSNCIVLFVLLLNEISGQCHRSAPRKATQSNSSKYRLVTQSTTFYILTSRRKSHKGYSFRFNLFFCYQVWADIVYASLALVLSIRGPRVSPFMTANWKSNLST